MIYVIERKFKRGKVWRRYSDERTLREDKHWLKVWHVEVPDEYDYRIAIYERKEVLP